MLGVGQETDLIDGHVRDPFQIRRHDAVFHHACVHFGKIQNGGNQRDEAPAAVRHDAQRRALLLGQRAGNLIQ